MLKDFRDYNKDMVTMFRGTDKTHKFRYVEASGSQFNWDEHIVTCEGRLSPAHETADMTFAVDHFTDADGLVFGIILFPKELINNYVRENRISWRVLAEHNVTHNVSVINYGEIILKEV